MEIRYLAGSNNSEVQLSPFNCPPPLNPPVEGYGPPDGTNAGMMGSTGMSTPHPPVLVLVRTCCVTCSDRSLRVYWAGGEGGVVASTTILRARGAVSYKCS